MKDTEAEVIQDIARRQQLGLLKYGTTVAQNPLSDREWRQHAYEECLDMAIYLKRSIQETEKADRQRVSEGWLQLMREARDNCQASIAEDGISEGRREYRRELLARLDVMLAAVRSRGLE